MQNPSELQPSYREQAPIEPVAETRVGVEAGVRAPETNPEITEAEIQQFVADLVVTTKEGTLDTPGKARLAAIKRTDGDVVAAAAIQQRYAAQAERLAGDLAAAVIPDGVDTLLLNTEKPTVEFTPAPAPNSPPNNSELTTVDGVIPPTAV